MRRSLCFFLSGTLLLVLVSVALLTSRSLAQPKETRSFTAAYVHGTLRVSIPYDAPRMGEGDLIVEVLDPEDGVVARTGGHVYVSAGTGLWEQALPLPKTLPFEDLVWHRVSYRFTYKSEQTAALRGIASISRILRRPAVRVLGQQSYLSGGVAAVRLIVTEADNETPVTSGSVQIELLGGGQKAQVLFTGKLNERGTTQVHFKFPAGLAGRYSLRYALDTALGPAEYVQEIRLEDKASILLTTEKPIYQPGQTIHARILALDRSDRVATAGRKLTFELDDSRGNKVFRRITQTDSYGIASAEFSLADEVNLGTYHLRALMDDCAEGPRNKADIALQVERYVLPKFKVAIELDGKNARAKRGYRPGDHIAGTVRANYFFGKPVDRAAVAVSVSGTDVTLSEAGSAQGQTDSDGAFRFDIRLPDFFTGAPLSKGVARVLVEATVKDAANHTESRGERVIVSESPLLITVVPEGGTLIPGLENQLFVITSYPDGSPAEADIRVKAPGTAGQTARTDRGGIAIVPWHGPGILTVHVEARDREGNHTSVRVPLESRPGSDQVLLRAEHAIYRAGDRIQLQVFSTRQGGTAYVDLLKDGQTIGTHDVNIVNGRAELAFNATPEMTGTVEFNAYLFGRDARAAGDHRLVFVQPADELRIQTALDEKVYKPGGEARIGFQVTNRRGEGVQAALGLSIVDQAVFALAEKHPGFEKVFFYLEQEAMKPRYEIHSVTLPEAISSSEPAESSRRDRVARALFSATELVRPSNTSLEFGRTLPQSKYSEYASRYQTRFRAQLNELAAAQTLTPDKNFGTCEQAIVTARVRSANLRDAWGNNLRVEDRQRGTRMFAVRSAGPDGQFNTGDDLIQYLEDRYCTEPNPWSSGNTINLRIEHDRGQQNGLAEITGTVKDPSGGVIPGAAIRLQETATGKVHILVSGAEGGFSLAALQAGRFDIRVSMPGFRTAARSFSLQDRDLATLSVVLDVGDVTQSVEVSAASPLFSTSSSSVSRPRAMTTPSIKKKDVTPQPSTPETHVRSWFPEALYVAPEIITDRHGRANITIPIADNITTWRMAMIASTKQGSLGSGTSSLKVFQDFFIELDLPVTITQGDQVSIPVAVYNYSGSRGQVRLRLEESDWFSLSDDIRNKSLIVESDRIGGSQFTIEAKRIGKFKLTLRAEMEGPAKRADIVVREIEVVPNGREQTMAFNGRLETSVEQAVNFPPNAIPDAARIFVRLYPGPMSQVVEGMDAILRMPYGCFEQTSSTTYPNILALDYMKRTKKLTPAVRAKAESFIANGYQRLMTFEVRSGGFSWFGQAPANKILTSYGLMEFSDMSKVYDIDRKIIQRIQHWLASQQQPDGSWKPDTSFINEGATNRYNTDSLRVTSYVAWALINTGYQGPEVEKARQFISRNRSGNPDPYTLAVLANFAVEYQGDRTLAQQAIQQLLEARSEKDDQAWWTTEETAVYGRGASAAVETTGLAVQALLKSGEAPAITRKALNYIAAQKDASGTWGTTQATIMALRALLLSTDPSDARGTVEITLNGKHAETLTLTPVNNDLFHQFVLKGVDFNGSNNVAVRFDGKGSLAYQVTGQYFVPWTAKAASEPLSIDVSYDRTRLAQGDFASAVATIKSHLSRTANMVTVDLGIPPGFDLLAEDLENYRNKSAGRKSGRLQKFTVTATQAILYFDSIAPGDTVRLSYRLRAKYPIRARTFQSRVYEYYDPAVNSVAQPVQMEVRKR